MIQTFSLNHFETIFRQRENKQNHNKPMADVIQLLPDSIANQIAAGEVIQRPASAVKELLENAIDAGATQIKVILKDAGKSLIQIIDNGCGMSDTDARMAFERHATSKIRASEDLFEIRTMGFRGEALASIAAIAHVELKSRQQKNDLGTRLSTEGSKVQVQEPCQTAVGSSFSIKNLFYNVPARRNFLKSDNVELRHIIDEFQRLAIAHADVHFTFHHNGNELFHLPSGNLRQRIVAVFGAKHNKKLVPISEDTDVVKISGFVGKPEFAKKSRGEQLFFVNNRFIKSSYLHHAVMSAYENLIPEKNYPFYAIFFEIDPAKIDINVHPTKQEIKFDNEREVYNYVRVAVRHALGQYAIMPSIDFDAETSFSNYQTAASAPKANPQQSTASTKSNDRNWSNVTNITRPNTASNLENWEKLFENLEISKEEETEEAESITLQSSVSNHELIESGEKEQATLTKDPFQIQNTYILSHIKSGFLLIDQQSAHERVLYEQYLKQMAESTASTQKELFAQTLEISTADTELLKSILPNVNALGYDIQEFGNNTFVMHGVPATAADLNHEKVIEQLLEQYRNNLELKLDVNENIAQSMARSTAIKRGKSLSVLEMKTLVDQLFATELPFTSPTGKKCFINYEMEELSKLFEG